MKNLYCEIFTDHSLEAVEHILNNVSLKEGSIKGIFSGKYLVGSIENSKFKYITYTNPPMEIHGQLTPSMNGSLISINIKAESSKEQAKALIYALSYPILFVVILLAIIKYPTNVFTYILGLISLTIPLIVYHFYVFFEHMDPEPNDVISKLLKDLNGKIETKSQ